MESDPLIHKKGFLSSKKFKIVGAIVGLGIGQIATNVSNKISIDQYTGNLAFFQAQFMNVIYVVLGVSMMLPMRHWNMITPMEETNLKWRHLWYFITAILDSISVLAIALGGNYTPGDWQTVIQQLTFPLTFIIAPIVFKSTRDYMKASLLWTMISITGSILLIAGILFTILPGLSSENSTYKNYAVITFASSGLFSTISFLIKEWYLQYRRDIFGQIIPGSAVRMNVWNAIYMVPITFILWPLQSVSIYGGIPIENLPSNLLDGCYCFLGYNISSTVPGSNCEGAWLSEMVFSLGTFIAGVFAVILVKEGSAAFQWAANIFVVPFSNIIFSLPIMPPDTRQSLTWYIWVGFTLVSFGIFIYGVGEIKSKELFLLKTRENQINDAYK